MPSFANQQLADTNRGEFGRGAMNSAEADTDHVRTSGERDARLTATQRIKQTRMKAEREVLKMIRDAKRRKTIYNPANITKEHQEAIVRLVNKKRIEYLQGVGYIQRDIEDRT